MSEININELVLGKKFSELRNYCLSLPAVTEDIKWEHNLCFSVKGKMFLLISLDAEPPPVSFKTTDELFYELQEQESFRPAPYLARNKWLTCDDINAVEFTRLKELIETSYELIKLKLPKKVQAELNSSSTF